MCSGIKGTQEAEALAAMRRAVPPASSASLQHCCGYPLSAKPEPASASNRATPGDCPRHPQVTLMVIQAAPGGEISSQPVEEWCVVQVSPNAAHTCFCPLTGKNRPKTTINSRFWSPFRRPSMAMYHTLRSFCDDGQFCNFLEQALLSRKTGPDNLQNN